MDITQYIKMCLVARGSNMSKLSADLGCSASNLSQKCSRQTFSPKELEEIANALNADLRIEFIDRETGKPIVAND